MKKNQIKKDDAISSVVLKKFIDRKGFYKLYKELKNKKTVDDIIYHFEDLDNALKFLDNDNSTPENLFNFYIKEKLKLVDEHKTEEFCINIYFIIINEYPKTNWKMHEIAELFYAYKPSSKKITTGINSLLNYLKTFEENIETSKEEVRRDADELLRKHSPKLDKVKPLELSSIYNDIDKTLKTLHELLEKDKFIDIQYNKFKIHFFNTIAQKGFIKI